MGTNAKQAQALDYLADAPGYATHEVLNQAGALVDYDAYGDDKPLVQAMKVFGADWADEVLHRAGRHVGSQKVQHLARQANRHLPELCTHDRFGNRIDVVEFHPAYHELMGLIYGTQAHSFAWTHQGRLGAQVVRGALSKWFFSVPMSDLFLTLAQTEKGLSCFVATGWLPDGSRNRLKIQRLKDKCGNKSNASSEVEFYDLYATMLGEEGRGIRTIIEMAHMTRLDFAIGSCGLMRQALSQAIHHTTNRRAFQRSLVDLPVMRNVVADLAIESEALMWMSMRLAAALDREHVDRSEQLLSRICTPVAKYWACKRAPQFVAEALECHGGNGFIGDHLIERLYREAPLNGIWEGTANVICLDVLRSMQREPDTVAAFLDEVRQAHGADARLDSFTKEVERRLGKLSEFEPVARRIVEMLAFALQASLLVRYSTPSIADAFCATRLDGDWGRAFGTMPQGLDTHAIVDRARIAAP
jgi:putative acyl-CoA dehydrogenase